MTTDTSITVDEIAAEVTRRRAAKSNANWSLSAADARAWYAAGWRDLSGAYLRRADLTEANLFGADLSGANLRGADLSGAKGILTCGPAPHSGRIISAYYHAGDTHIQAGCFNGTLAAFKQRVEHPDTAGEYPTTPEGQAWYRSLFPILDYFASLNPTNIERNPQ